MSRRHVLALLLPAALLGTALATPPGTAATINPGSVAGRVTNLVDAPLRGMRVEVVFNRGFGDEVVGQDLTDSRGRYRVDDLPENDFYKVRFVDPGGGYASEYYDDALGTTDGAWVPVTRYEVTRGADAVLEPAASISGRLTDAAGQPLPGVEVLLYVSPGINGYILARDGGPTDADGRYSVDRLPSATYHLEFSSRPTVALECWLDQPSLFTSTPLRLGTGQHVTGLDVVVGLPDPPVALPPPPVVNRVAPSIDGKPRVGRALTGHAGRWTPVSVARSFQWYADGRPILGATHQRFTVRKAQLGKRLLLLVTARAPGYDEASAVSERTTRVRP
jgi:hypothetical protein